MKEILRYQRLSTYFKAGQKNIIEGILYFSRFFRNQKKIILKPSLLILVAVFFVILSGLETANLANSFGQSFLAELIEKEEIIIEIGLPTIPTENSKSNFQLAGTREEIVEPLEIVGALGALVAPETEFNEVIVQTRTEIENYIVQSGDTVSSIAAKFGLTWSTILWENNLSYWSIIKPGDELRILPINGITHKVKTGENLSYIATKYKTSIGEIALANSLTEDSLLEPGEVLILPDGSTPPAPKPIYQPAQPVFVQENYSGYWDWRKNTQCHRFVAQQCTDWVAYKWATDQGQCVPSWSHAKYWYGKAQANPEYKVGSTPQIGAIMVLKCTSYLCYRYGHVAYVEDFDGETVTISEMNGPKRQAYTERTLNNKTNVWQGPWKIAGYIYPE